MPSSVANEMLPDTQGSWLQSICLLVNVFGKRMETGSYMNTDLAHNTDAVFLFLEVIKEEFFLLFPPVYVFNLSLPLSLSLLY